MLCYDVYIVFLRVTCWKMLITVALTKCVYFKIHHGGRCCVSKICGIAFEWELAADCTLIAKNIVTYIKMFCRFSLWRQKWERGRDSRGHSGGSVTGWQLHTTSFMSFIMYWSEWEEFRCKYNMYVTICFSFLFVWKSNLFSWKFNCWPESKPSGSLNPEIHFNRNLWLPFHFM